MLKAQICLLKHFLFVTCALLLLKERFAYQDIKAVHSVSLLFYLDILIFSGEMMEKMLVIVSRVCVSIFLFLAYVSSTLKLSNCFLLLTLSITNSIRRRALDLLYGMCDVSNAKDIVEELLQVSGFCIVTF